MTRRDDGRLPNISRFSVCPTTTAYFWLTAIGGWPADDPHAVTQQGRIEEELSVLSLERPAGLLQPASAGIFFPGQGGDIERHAP